MHREGHIGIGLLFYAPIAGVLTYYDLLSVMVFGLICAVVFSYAPDFDLWLPVVSHRGVTHTLVGGIVASCGASALAIWLALDGILHVNTTIVMLSQVGAFAFGVSFVGFLSHLAGDILTPMGITPFWPWSSRTYTLDLVYASNQRANEFLSQAGAVGVTTAIVAAFMLRNGVFNTFLLTAREKRGVSCTR